MIIKRFPGIKAIALIIAYDNDMINRSTTVNDWLESLDPILGATGVDESDLVMLDKWCQSLTLEQKEILGSGEENKIKEIEHLCLKPELCGLFNDIFEGG